MNSAVGQEAADTPAVAEKDPDKVTSSIGAGGTGRFVTGRWGVVKATFYNPGESAKPNLLVVTPDGSGGLQYARRIEIPARTAFETTWPVRVEKLSDQSTVEFEYLHFPSGEDDGVIRHQQHDRQIPSFFGMTKSAPGGLCGLIFQSGDGGSENSTHQLLRSMRFGKIGDQVLVAIPVREITERRECLDPLDQLGICDPELNQKPQACEAIRGWVRRGGRLLIDMDSVGVDVVQSLLGESLPLTIVGETSTNSVRLEINPDYQQNQYPTRFVDRTFPEPVRYHRVVAGAGETIWSVDGWPVAIRVPVGNGVVVVTTISPDVFIEQRADAGDGKPEYTMIASSRRMVDSLFSPRIPLLISEAAASQQAAEMVGYEVPSRLSAMWLLVIFPVVLIVVGVVLQRRAIGERLVWVLPGLAILAAIPSVAFGLLSQSVARTTIVETSVIHSQPKASDVVSDGYATIYVPEERDLAVSSSSNVVLESRADAANLDYRRLIWTGPTDSRWLRLNQHKGLKTFPIRREQQLSSPIYAVATFDKNGLTGKLMNGGLEATSDLLVAGNSPDRMSLQPSADGSFQGGFSEVLAADQFTLSSLVSEDQLFRSALMDSVFASPDGLEAFPPIPSLLFWTEPVGETLTFEQDGVRRKRLALVVQPLTLEAPEAGQLITIPPTFVKYRSVQNEDGSYSSVFENIRRRWNPTESSAKTRLLVEIPSVCLPFELDSVDVSLLIRAASRQVTVLSGSADDLKAVTELESPLGTKTFSLPPDSIREGCRTGRFLLQINVSDLDKSLQTDSMTGEQDDNWQIERLLLTVKGRRAGALVAE